MIWPWRRRAEPPPLPHLNGETANRFVGVYGAPDAAAALRATGVKLAWNDARVAFGHSPIWAEAECQLCVAGEAWLDNAAELRQRLALPKAEAPELLGQLYRQGGVTGLREALGMFAIAIWDGRQQQLRLVRDGVGARTLYYTRTPSGWWFANRLSSLQRCPAVSSELSLTALRNYLTFAYVPGPETLWQDVWEVRPGMAVVIPGGQLESYWEPGEGLWDPSESIEAHAHRLRALLDEAVRVRLPSAGPVGVFLSGGIDSSLVTALAARFAPGPVHTYAIHFGEHYPNELAFSDMVARHCGTQHHVLALSARQVQAQLPETMRALDDPIGDPLTVPNLLLGQMAAHDTDIILNGEGGDPCFGGPKNLPMVLNELYANDDNRAAAYFRAYQKCYDDLPQLLTPEARARLRLMAPQATILQPFWDSPTMRHFLNKLTHLNIRLKGADHILTKVNNLTTASGVSGRSPLFDRRVVEASFAIPPHYKLSGAKEKAVLKHAVTDLLPMPILTRPKSGMLVPVQGWFRRDLRRFTQGMLLSRHACIRPYISQARLREWLNYRGELWPRQGVKLWLLLTLEVWLRVQQ